MNNKYKIFFYYWLPVILYCFLIFKQSSSPVILPIPSLPHIDKLFHAVGYAILAILFCRAFKSLGILDVHTMMFLNILLSAVYGFSDEIHQYFVPYRSADINDFLANVIGSLLGVFIYHLLTNKLQHRIEI